MTAAVQAELFRQEPRSRALDVLDQRRRGATFVEHNVRSILNSPDRTNMPFWSLNPYVGCEFGCTYCYARYAHRYVVERANDAGQISNEDLDEYRQSSTWEIFERQIFVKRREAVLDALSRDLGRIHRWKRRGAAYPIVIGTATDPYQPAERRFAITRAVLERLLDEQGLGIGIITKSPLVQQDIDLLVELQRHNRVSVYVSLISTDPEIIKKFEARSPMPHVRLKTLHRLIEAGINAGLIVAPVLPGITDTEEQISALARAVRHTGGRFAHPSPLRLYPALHRGFLPVVEQHFPHLADRYRRAYRGTGSAPKSYTDKLTRRFRRIALAHGIPVKDPILEDRTPRPLPHQWRRDGRTVRPGATDIPDPSAGIDTVDKKQIELWHG